MSRISILIIFIPLMLFPHRVFAQREAYYARYRSARSGSESTRIVSAAVYLKERIYIHRSEHHRILRSIRLLLPVDRGAGLVPVVSSRLSSVLHLPDRSIRIELTRRVLQSPVPRAISVRRRAILYLTSEHRIVSGNPVWDACVSGRILSRDLLRSNRDYVEHRQRRTRVRIPLSCRDYHRGESGIWRLPFPYDGEVALDRKGRLVGDIPSSYELRISTP